MDFELKNKSNIKGTCWIEFNISGTIVQFENWSKSSVYLEEYAYNRYFPPFF